MLLKYRKLVDSSHPFPLAIPGIIDMGHRTSGELDVSHS